MPARLGLMVDHWTIEKLAQLAGHGHARAVLLAAVTVDADDVRAAFDRVWSSEDRLEGIRAFREKRRAEFRGQ